MALQEQFKSVLGRSPTADETEFFQKFIKEENLTPYEIGQILQSTPEAQQSRMKTQGAEYESLLAGADERALGQAQDQITQRMLGQGRQTSGSGYAGAYFSAARDLASARQNKMADFYGGGIQNVNQTYSSQGQSALGQGYGQRQAKQDRAWALEDYYRQQNDFNNYLRGQSTRNLQGSLMNAGLGLATTGLTGGMGAAFGSGFSSMFGGKS